MRMISYALYELAKIPSHKNKRAQKLEGFVIRWRAFRKFGGNPGGDFYYLIKSLVGLIFPSTTYFD